MLAEDAMRVLRYLVGMVEPRPGSTREDVQLGVRDGYG
jgi:hypothetical protein